MATAALTAKETEMVTPRVLLLYAIYEVAAFWLWLFGAISISWFMIGLMPVIIVAVLALVGLAGLKTGLVK